MKIWRWVLMAALATALLTGCGILQPSLTVINNSSHTITKVRLTPSAASEYLIDVYIPTGGGKYVVESVWAGTYVLHAEDAGGGYWERPNYVMQRGIDYAWPLYNGDRKPF